MTGIEFVILTAILFSLFEIYIIFNYLKNKKYGRLFENIVVYIILVLFLCFKDILHLQIYDFIIIFLIITVFGHTFIGEYCNLYHKSKTYDRFLHLFGSFTFSLFSYSIIESITKPDLYSNIYVALFVAALGISIGVFFELAEFASDTFGEKSKYQKNQHGLADTDFDLLFNVIGASIAGYISIYLF